MSAVQSHRTNTSQIRRSMSEQTLGSNTGSAQSSDIALQWISECVSKHQHCTPTNVEAQLPTRLLYVGSSGAQSVRLCETNEFPVDTQYMTLSHCWGQHQLITLTSSNITAFEAGLEISKLPKAFQEAIYVSWRMSIQYLWIDSLCIIQNSEDDWKRESSHMMSVYFGAHCNIAASGAPNAQTGLFFDREAPIPRSVVLEIPAPPIRPFY